MATAITGMLFLTLSETPVMAVIFCRGLINLLTSSPNYLGYAICLTGRQYLPVCMHILPYYFLQHYYTVLPDYLECFPILKTLTVSQTLLTLNMLTVAVATRHVDSGWPPWIFIVLSLSEKRESCSKTGAASTLKKTRNKKHFFY